jgi:hypothetical protein
MNARKDGGWKNKPMKQDEPPPFLGSWNRVYVAIIVYTCALVISLFFMTAALNR